MTWLCFTGLGLIAGASLGFFGGAWWAANQVGDLFDQLDNQWREW